MKRLLLTALLLSVGTTWADPLEDGIAAHERGDYANALGIYLPLATQGVAEAQSNLGFMYSKGQGVAQDYAEAVKWTRLAAVQGVAEAQSNLGGMYRRGEGVAQDYVEAVKWTRLAAVQGYAEAQYNLGVSYEKGQGVAQNYAEAVKWYRLSAAQGDGLRSTISAGCMTKDKASRRITQKRSSGIDCQQRRELRWRNLISAGCMPQGKASRRIWFARTCGSILALSRAM